MRRSRYAGPVGGHRLRRAAAAADTGRHRVADRDPRRHHSGQHHRLLTRRAAVPEGAAGP